jgi:hypothetical protein
MQESKWVQRQFNQALETLRFRNQKSCPRASIDSEKTLQDVRRLHAGLRDGALAESSRAIDEASVARKKQG